MGYYFVVTIYKNGRCSYSEKQYKSEREAELRAQQKRKRADVKSAYVCYQMGLPVDIKKYV